MTVPTVAAGTPTQSAWANIVAAEVNGLVPIGTVWMGFFPADLATWLILDGRELSRTGIYAALYAAIGTYGGPGNGTTTWTLPDFRNRLPMGTGPTPSVGLGGVGGSKDSGLVSHSHTINNHGHATAGQSTTHYHGLEGHQHYCNLPDVGDHNHAGAGGNVFVVSVGGVQSDGVVYGNAAGRSNFVTYTYVNPGGGHGHDGWSDGAGAHAGMQGADRGHDHGATGNPTDRGTDTQGVAGTNTNLPPYLGINFIVRY